MSNNILVSVITPVYGISARILAQTLDSLVAQDLREAEFLLVNDASPDDHTAGILAEYAQRDPRFRIFTHEVNRGRSQARNRAIDEARGVYVALFDADDLLSPNYCRILATTAEFYQADMVTAGIVKFRDGEYPQIVNQYQAEDFCKKNWTPGRSLVRQRFICRLFRRSVLKELRFDAELYRGEDVLFIHAALLRCARTVELNYPGYFYRVTCLDPVPTSAAEAGTNNRKLHAYRNAAKMICKITLLGKDCKDARERAFLGYLAVRRLLRHIFSARCSKIHDAEMRSLLREEWRQVNTVLRTEFTREYPQLFKLIEWLLVDDDAKWYEAPTVWLVRAWFELCHIHYGVTKITCSLRMKITGITS